jgi:hypothetical protein
MSIASLNPSYGLCVNSTPILLELSAAPHLRVLFICVSDPSCRT